MRTVRLGLLLCDEIYMSSSAIEGARGDYTDIFRQFLSASLRQITTEVAFTLDVYDVVHDLAYPPDDVDYDGILISGSRASANDKFPWVIKLLAYIKRIVADRPSLKLFGICFGHQVICKALGCTVEQGNWEASVTPIRLTPIGKALFHTNSLRLQVMRHDVVVGCPPHAYVLGSTDLTANQGIVLFAPGSPFARRRAAFESPWTATASWASASDTRVPLTAIQVLTFQGHVEFTEPVVRALLPEFADALGSALVEDVLRRVGWPTDATDSVGRVVWGMLGVTRVGATAVRARL